MSWLRLDLRPLSAFRKPSRLSFQSTATSDQTDLGHTLGVYCNSIYTPTERQVLICTDSVELQVFDQCWDLFGLSPPSLVGAYFFTLSRTSCDIFTLWFTMLWHVLCNWGSEKYWRGGGGKMEKIPLNNIFSWISTVSEI